MRRLFLNGIIVAALAVGGLLAPVAGQTRAPGVAGNWRMLLEMPNAPSPYPICTFTQNGTALTGTCGVPTFPLPIVSGSVNAAAVTWSWQVGPDLFLFTGTLDAAGTTIKGALVMRGQAGERNATFTAERTNETQELKFARVDRAGQRTILGPAASTTFAPRVSPDGARIAYDQYDGTLWLAQVGGSAPPVLLPVPAESRFPVWAGDGRLLFTAPADGVQAIYSIAVGGGAPELLVTPGRAPESWSPARNGLSFIRLTGEDYDIWFYSAVDRTVTPLVVIPGSRQLSSHLSPDGRWLAYMSDETGSFEVYVQPFPSGTRTRVTPGGGRDPRWSPDGRELFFDDTRQIYSMAITDGPTLTFAPPRPVPIDGLIQGNSLRRLWDVTSTGSFLALVR